MAKKKVPEKLLRDMRYSQGKDREMKKSTDAEIKADAKKRSKVNTKRIVAKVFREGEKKKADQKYNSKPRNDAHVKENKRFKEAVKKDSQAEIKRKTPITSEGVNTNYNRKKRKKDAEKHSSYRLKLKAKETGKKSWNKKKGPQK